MSFFLLQHKCNPSWQNFHFRILSMFSISPKPSQVSFPFISAINSLISVFFSIQSCRLGGPRIFCPIIVLAECFAAEFSLPY
jgi:hypothetical protein